MSHRLDGRFDAELLPQPAHADVHNVGPRMVVVAPGRQDAVARDHLAGVLHEMVEQPELAIGEVDRLAPDPGLAPGNVDHEFSRLEVRALVVRTQLNPHARQQLID